MNKNSLNAEIMVILCVVILTSPGCGTATRPEEAFSPVGSQKTLQPPRRLITDYSGMEQNDTVAWFWRAPGFSPERCSSIKIHPLENYSSFKYPWARKRIETALQKMFGTPDGAPRQGTLDVGIRTAIVELKPKKGFLKRFKPAIDDFPYIEIEMIMFEETTQTILLKLCHAGKHDEFKNALDAMLHDLQIFFSTEF